MTIVVWVDPSKPDRDVLKIIGEKVREGKTVVYPTETCYGLGANALDAPAVMRVRKIKRRSKGKPLSIIVSSLEMMEEYGYLDEKARFLAKCFMPGPLTLIVKKKTAIPDVVNREEIAFRISSHPVALALVEEAGVPLTATSANPEGLNPPYRVEEALAYFKGQVDFIIDSGELPGVRPSTILDVKGSSLKLVREGPISLEEIRLKLKELGSGDCEGKYP